VCVYYYVFYVQYVLVLPFGVINDDDDDYVHVAWFADVELTGSRKQRVKLSSVAAFMISSNSWDLERRLYWKVSTLWHQGVVFKNTDLRLFLELYSPWVTKKVPLCFDYTSGVSWSIFKCVSYAEARNRYRLDVCPSVCPSHAGIVSKRLKILSFFLRHTIAHSF